MHQTDLESYGNSASTREKRNNRGSIIVAHSDQWSRSVCCHIKYRETEQTGKILYQPAAIDRLHSNQPSYNQATSNNTGKMPEPTSSPQVLRITRSDEPESFVLLRVSSSPSKALDLDIAATEGENPYTGSSKRACLDISHLYFLFLKTV